MDIEIMSFIFILCKDKQVYKETIRDTLLYIKESINEFVNLKNNHHMGS